MPDGPPPVFRLFQLFNEVGIIAQLSRTLLEAQLPEGVIAPHFGVLNHLSRVGDGRTPLRIARAFQVPKTSMTHTIKGLEARGWVEVRPNPEDGRSKCVWLTDAGRVFLQETQGKLVAAYGGMAEGIDPATIERLLPDLERIRVYLDDNRVADQAE